MWGVATTRGSEEFGRLVGAEAKARNFEAAGRRAFVADGQAYNWAIQKCWFAAYTPVTDLLVRFASPVVVDIIASFSVMTHFEGFQRGVIDLRDFLFFASLIGFALFATSVIIRSQRSG